LILNTFKECGMPALASTNDFLIAGKVGAPHGVKGWVKVFSYTQPIDNLIHYQPWQLEIKNTRHPAQITHHQIHGDSILVGFEGITDRDQAAKLTHAAVIIARSSLPPLNSGEYYWHDLVGLEVTNLTGFIFGHITRLLSTGANDVMFIKGKKEYCLPYVSGTVVKNVDLTTKQMLVDWPEEI
jgi:16S rRNA processing protein RimM